MRCWSVDSTKLSIFQIVTGSQLHNQLWDLAESLTRLRKSFLNDEDLIKNEGAPPGVLTKLNINFSSYEASTGSGISVVQVT